jgi:hypothetical protein
MSRSIPTDEPPDRRPLQNVQRPFNVFHRVLELALAQLNVTEPEERARAGRAVVTPERNGDTWQIFETRR